MKEIDLPDFEDMFSIIETIRNLSVETAALKSTIEVKESNITQTATENESYFVGGKPPSMAYIQRTYLHAGFDGELLPLRQELASREADLEYYKMRLDLNKLIVDVWRTESANKRLAVD